MRKSRISNRKIDNARKESCLMYAFMYAVENKRLSAWADVSWMILHNIEKLSTAFLDCVTQTINAELRSFVEFESDNPLAYEEFNSHWQQVMDAVSEELIARAKRDEESVSADVQVERIRRSAHERD
jgi:hypothetical protein